MYFELDNDDMESSKYICGERYEDMIDHRSYTQLEQLTLWN